MSECVKDICDGKVASADRDRIPGQPDGIALPSHFSWCVSALRAAIASNANGLSASI